MAIAPPQNPSELGMIKGGHTRPHNSAMGVVANKPAAVAGDPGWTGIGRDAPGAQAAHAERVVAKLKADTPRDAGGTGVIKPAAKRAGQQASNAAGKGRSK